MQPRAFLCPPFAGGTFPMENATIERKLPAGGNRKNHPSLLHHIPLQLRQHLRRIHIRQLRSRDLP